MSPALTKAVNDLAFVAILIGGGGLLWLALFALAGAFRKEPNHREHGGR